MPQVSSNSVAQALHAWFRGCPLLRAGAKVGVDYLADTQAEYAIYATPSPIRTRENVLGEEVPEDVQTLNFVFASRQPYGADTRQNLENQEFYEGVTSWIWQQNEARTLPSIPGGVIRSIVPTLTAFISDAGADTAKYQIQLKITYRRT